MMLLNCEYCYNTHKTERGHNRHIAWHKEHGDDQPYNPDGVRLDYKFDGRSFAYTSTIAFKRDKGICQACKRHKDDIPENPNRMHRKMEVHHILSKQDGGSDHQTNLVTLCWECHQKTFKNKGRSGFPRKEKRYKTLFEVLEQRDQSREMRAGS